MSYGFVISAQNNTVTDYIHCAEVLCRNIKDKMPGADVTLVTDKTIRNSPFDRVVVYPWGDTCKNDRWKLANDWQVYWATPYEYTIKLEADIYLPRSIHHWWDNLSPHDIVICTTIRDIGGAISGNRYYRRLFDQNKLPDVYNAITYFRKSSRAEEFYSLVRNIFENWNKWRLLLKYCNEPATTDVVYAMAAKLIGVENCTLPGSQWMSMAHLKQEIIGAQTENWTNELLYELAYDHFRVETLPQLWPVHYHIKNFSKVIEDELWPKKIKI